MSGRVYQSGAQKRKEREERAISDKKQRGSMDKYVIRKKSKTNEPSETVEQVESSSESSDDDIFSEGEEDPSSQLQSMDPYLPDQDRQSSNEILHVIYPNANLDPTFSSSNVNDPGLWPASLTDKIRELIISAYPKQIDFNFENSVVSDGAKNRHFRRELFNRSLPSNKIIKRDWLIYSHTTKRAYCWVCKLFGSSNPSGLASDGTNDWKNISAKLKEHECGKDHFQNVAIKVSRLSKMNRIDADLEDQIEQEVSYWKEVLKRLVSAIKFLTSRGLALRGDNELLNNAQNGNFLGTIEFLAEWDKFMKEHLENHGNKGTGISIIH